MPSRINPIESEGHEIKPEKTPLLFLAVDDVETLDHGLDSAADAPQCCRKTDDETDAQGTPFLCCEGLELRLDEIQPSARHDAWSSPHNR